ncbi:MAG: hypothetical protein R3E58_21115 [Phycisphaerae bacterium]
MVLALLALGEFRRAHRQVDIAGVPQCVDASDPDAKEFNACVDISACRDRKLAALAAHESQVKRLMPECDWPILSDISNGAWLAACTQDIEIFSVCESDCIPR